MDNFFIDFFLIVILFFGNIFFENSNYYFLLIYISLLLYHIYSFNLLIKNTSFIIANNKRYFLISVLLYFFTYYLICDPNPFLAFIFYYVFYPNFIKAIVIIFIHTYFLSISLNIRNRHFINYSEVLPFKNEYNRFLKHSSPSYLFSKPIQYIKNKKLLKASFFGLIFLFFFNVFIFENRIALWVYFYEKSKALPISFSKNRIFYIASNVVNIESIIEVYIEEMKKLIHYLGENNVIISIVENGDSFDNTKRYLEEFQNYLQEKKVLNKFILTKEVEDPRKVLKPFIKSSRLRIEFFSKLRNKCFEYLYEFPGIDFDNTIVIFFNDVIFNFEDIINLLSTNHEDFDSVCALDMKDHYFYDRWVTIDLDGNGLKKYFPFFINKEAQNLIMNHKPIRVFSCWNGVIAFKASSLKDKQLQFRHKIKYTLPKYLLNNANKNYYESECTYFNIDLFSLGYTKIFINPDVRVAYSHKAFFYAKYNIPSILHIAYSFILYFIGILRKRNKLMSNYDSKYYQLNQILRNWYNENKK